jgi:hypothetical protein
MRYKGIEFDSVYTIFPTGFCSDSDLFLVYHRQHRNDITNIVVEYNDTYVLHLSIIFKRTVMNLPDKGYSRNASCGLNSISTLPYI